jgi:lysine/ornithine N-monooxygenase
MVDERYKVPKNYKTKKSRSFQNRIFVENIGVLALGAD